MCAARLLTSILVERMLSLGLANAFVSSDRGGLRQPCRRATVTCAMTVPWIEARLPSSIHSDRIMKRLSDVLLGGQSFSFGQIAATVQA